MKRINILHLSDLHLYKPITTKVGHIKDKRLSRKFKKELGYGDIFSVLKTQLLVEFKDKKIDGIACTGDLCEAKKGRDFSFSMGYLNEIAQCLSIPSQNVFISPGNHDIDRDKKTIKGSLNNYLRGCREYGFTTCSEEAPFVTNINNVPIVILNTCLGGTEKIDWSKGKIFWSELKLSLKPFEASYRKVLKEASLPIPPIDELDIPAIGVTQMDKLQKELIIYSTDCLFVLGHHSPLPSPGVEVRPYSNLIDGGVLLWRLASKKKVIYLHGHKHLRSTLLSSPLDTKTSGGMLLANGVTHFVQNINTIEFSHIELLCTNEGNLLCCIINHYESVGASIHRTSGVKYYPESGDKLLNIHFPLSAIGSQRLSFKVMKQKYHYHDDDELAEDLLKLCGTRCIIINKIDDPFDDWDISGNIDSQLTVGK